LHHHWQLSTAPEASCACNSLGALSSLQRSTAEDDGLLNVTHRLTPNRFRVLAEAQGLPDVIAAVPDASTVLMLPK
jgi:hypothetical protein